MVNHFIRNMFVESSFASVFGLPGQGFHSDRSLGLAKNDIVGTFVVAVILSIPLRVSILQTFLSLWFIGIGFHLLFGVKTPVTRVIMS